MDKLPGYLTSLMIAFAGLGFFVFSLWYVVNFPVPYSMQPLKQRIVVMFQIEQAKLDMKDFVVIAGDEVYGYTEPSYESEEIGLIEAGEYELVGGVDGWSQIILDNDLLVWVSQDFIKVGN
ncbi:MAG: SH3 domain-containing protein [Candidatus Pacebacteria bacterium]|nr:SH3 domain-containing protein [Candidatus Paceibacterota bacterium]